MLNLDDQFPDYRTPQFSFRIQVQDVVVSPFTFSCSTTAAPPEGVDTMDLGIRRPGFVLNPQVYFPAERVLSLTVERV